MFDWSGYLDLAKSLAKPGADESALRSAVSRAYYAVFNPARELLVAEGSWSFAPGQGSHKDMWDTFSGHDRLRSRISVRGNRLRTRRNKADYAAGALIKDRDAADSIQLADMVLIDLKSISLRR